VSCSLRPVGRAQRGPLERLTAATGLFRPDEVAIAVELLDEALAGDDDYRFVGAYTDDALVGYACWGPTPATTGTFDLYWIVVETSSRAAYAPTRAFYERRGYTQAARLPGYYAPGDDLVIYLKDLTHGVLATGTA